MRQHEKHSDSRPACPDARSVQWQQTDEETSVCGSRLDGKDIRVRAAECKDIRVRAAECKNIPMEANQPGETPVSGQLRQ